MILTPDDRIAAHIGAGAWSRTTVDDLFRRRAGEADSEVVFADRGMAGFEGGSSTLTGAEAERRVEGIAAFFAAVGLKPDTVLGMHVPASTDAAVIMLAALRAGLIVCAMPLHWTRAEMEEAVAATGMRAIVTASRIEDEPSGEKVRDVAAETFAIRFVFAIGTGVPDGLIDLAEVLAEIESLGPAPVPARRGPAADHVALLSLVRTADDRFTVAPFSHNHLMAAALAQVLETRADRRGQLSTLHPAGLAGFVGGILAPMLAGAPALFHHVRSLAGLAAAAADSAIGRALVPASVAPLLRERLGPSLALGMVRHGGDAAPALGEPATGDLDILTLGGLTLLPLARTAAGELRAIRAGAAHFPDGEAASPALAEIRVKASARTAGQSGELILGGPLVADAPWPEQPSANAMPLPLTSDGALKTGLAVQGTEKGGTLHIALPAGVVVQAGRLRRPDRLESLFMRHPAFAEVSVRTVPDTLLGCRFVLDVVPRGPLLPDLAELAAWIGEVGGTSLDAPVALAVVPAIDRPATPVAPVPLGKVVGA